ncbi:MAG: biotin/lipoate A/B protein ligase family protein [Planctomycetota bacterium]|jgi:lipoate-protein ligase A
MKDSRWRYIEDDGSSASFGPAADEYIARKLCTSSYSYIIRLYTYRGPSVIVGRNQDIESEVNLACCTKLGIDINRRPTGGGAIVMGEGQLGIAIAGPVNDQSPLLASKTVFGPFTKGIIVALGLLGIKSEFRPKNDIHVKGRKIAGLASCTFDGHPAGLYHASILADMDTDLMLRLLKKPGRKDGSITTVSSELGRYVSTHELRECVKRGFEKALNAELIPAPLNKEELAEIRELEERKYKSRDWVYHGKEHSTQYSHEQLEIATGLRPSQ